MLISYRELIDILSAAHWIVLQRAPRRQHDTFMATNNTTATV